MKGCCLLTTAGTKGHHITDRTELHRVRELSVLYEHVVQSVHVRDLLQGVEDYNKETLQQKKIINQV